ncbi:MAG: hypothetical protein N4A45_12220 [Flavobacteriales bacterium]|jgi:hypothetical protein|nr:hypothetical protein [Flavobacteriales bacterium]
MDEDKYTEVQYQALKYSNEQFDKNILFIASGALGISFAFIEKVIPDLSKAVYKNSLIASWYCFAGVIFISLSAHLLSMMANRWAIANVNHPEYEKITTRWNLLIRGINIAMILGLLAGNILLISFIKLNIS